MSAIDQEQALALELRVDGGGIVATEYVAIIDTEYLLSLPPADADGGEDLQLSDEQEAEIDEMVEQFAEESFLESLERADAPVEWPRYQVQVRLVDHDAIP